MEARNFRIGSLWDFSVIDVMEKRTSIVDKRGEVNCYS